METRSITAGARVRVRGEEWILSLRTAHTDCEAVRLAGCGPSNAGVRRTLLLPFDRLETVGATPRVRVVGRRRWLRHVARGLVAADSFGGIDSVAPAAIQLVPFQLEPALAMLRHACLRILIADEVGLGKTIQAGVILRQLSSETDAFRAIVLTPAGIREQWVEELRARFSLEATVTDAAWLAARARDLPPELNPWSLPGIWIASLDLVKRPEVLRALEDITWDIAVLDEIHGAGAGTARMASAHAVASRARRVVLLTATPPDGDPAHFAAVTGLGRHGSAGALTEFRRTRADTGITVRRKSVLLPVRLSRLERRMHRLLEHYTMLVWAEAGARQDTRARLAALILRKRALSSASSLAISVRRRLARLGAAPFQDEQQLLLPLLDEDPLDDGLADEVIGASGLSDVALERACLEEIAAVADQASRRESKLALLRRLLARTREPIIVFTEYRDTLAWIAAAVAPLRTPVLLHGDMTPRERADVQRQFNEAGGLLLATDAASEGLNLQERCRVVVHFELPWTPARLEQRTGRVDRLGQSRPVHEILLVARDTCERLVLAPLVKRARAAAARGGKSSRLAAFTEATVADAVMGRIPIPNGPPTDIAGTLSLNLRAEATVEAARLSTARAFDRLTTLRTPRLRPEDVAVNRDRHGPRTVVLIVVEAGLERADGRRVHAEVVPVAVRIDPQRLPNAANALKGIASDLIRVHGPRVLAAAETASRSNLAEAATRYHDAVAALARRERGVAGAAGSAARRLVQVGLFDAREARALDARREAASRALLDANERLADLSPAAALHPTYRIVAVRFGSMSLPP